MAAFSGHIHSDEFAVQDGVFYMSVNTTRNIGYKGNSEDHYFLTDVGDEYYLDFVQYDNNDYPVNVTVSEDDPTYRYVDENGNKVSAANRIQDYYTKLVDGQYVKEYLRDANGDPVWKVQKHVASYSRARDSWWSYDPLYAIVKMGQNGSLSIEGTESRWVADMTSPELTAKKRACYISSGYFEDGVWTKTAP